MLKLWKLFHERKVQETDAKKIIRDKYEAFLEILTENEHSLDLMTELESNYYENHLISIPYLKNVIKNLSKSIYGVIENLEKLSNRSYDGLNACFEDIETELTQFLTGSKLPIYTPVIIPMSDIHWDYVDKVGSKMASLGEMRKNLTISVPDGFAMTACAYTHFFEYNDLKGRISQILSIADLKQSQQLLKVEKELKKLFIEAEIPPEIEHIVCRESEKIEKARGQSIEWAVRSSAIGEDLENSFAGQFSSVLNVQTDQLLEKYKEVLASKYNARNILYQRMKKIRVEDVNMSVGIIEMVRPICSGVMYTTDPVKPHNQEIIISAVWGLSQLLVEGAVSADTYVLKRKPGFPLVKQDIAQKDIYLTRQNGGGVKHEPVAVEDRRKACLDDSQLQMLGKMGLEIEEYFKTPQDIEWCIDGNGRLILIQTRPLHVLTKTKKKKELQSANITIIVDNAPAVAAGVGAGKVFKVNDIHDMFNFPDGGVMVIKNSSPRFIGALHKATAVVVEKGNRTDHMSSVVREFKVPCVIKIPSIFSKLKNGQEITVDASEGKIYAGRVSELLQEEPILQELDSKIEHTESHILLEKIAGSIFPLNLTDPRLADFSEENCKTFHDILRFCHETALNEMFLLKEQGHLETIKNIYTIITPLPFSLSVFDLFGNTVNVDKKKTILPENVRSTPFQELWKGMTAPDVSWAGPAGKMAARDVIAAATRTPTYANNPEDTKSYAIVTPEYINLSLRMGYHFVVLDSYISNDPYNNYIALSFKGGAAELKKRNLRVLLIAAILKPLSFDVTVKNDFLKARIKSESDTELSQKMHTIGRLLGMTRLLDMAMDHEGKIDEYVAKFFATEDSPKNN